MNNVREMVVEPVCRRCDSSTTRNLVPLIVIDSLTKTSEHMQPQSSRLDRSGRCPNPHVLICRVCIAPNYNFHTFI